MDVKITRKGAFAVLGIERQGPADRGPEWIQPLWEEARARQEEVRPLLTNEREAWGLMSAIDEPLAPWKEEGKYLAGWEVPAETTPPASGSNAATPPIGNPYPQCASGIA